MRNKRLPEDVAQMIALTMKRQPLLNVDQAHRLTDIALKIQTDNVLAMVYGVRV